MKNQRIKSIYSWMNSKTGKKENMQKGLEIFIAHQMRKMPPVLYRGSPCPIEIKVIIHRPLPITKADKALLIEHSMGENSPS